MNILKLALTLPVLIFLTSCMGSSVDVELAGRNGPANEASGNGTVTQLEWTYLQGTGINFNSGLTASTPELAIFNDELFAIWAEENATAVKQTRVAKFTGTKSTPAWTLVDGAGANGINISTASGVRNPNLISCNGKLYGIWGEYAGAGTSGLINTRVTVWDGASTWTNISGAGLNYNLAEGTRWNFGICHLDKLVVGWKEENPATSNTQVRMIRLDNDVIYTWNFIDGNGVTGLNYDVDEDAGGPRLETFNSKLYIAFTQNRPGAFGRQIRVKVYDGSTWSHVEGHIDPDDGLNYNPTDDTGAARFHVVNNKLYIMFYERPGGIKQIRILKYNGNDPSPEWTFVDGDGAFGLNKDTTKSGSDPYELSSFKGNLYALWGESDGFNDQLLVKGFEDSDWTFRDDTGGVNGLNQNSSLVANSPHGIEFNNDFYIVWVEDSKIMVSVGAK
jgi:hypothetical protein